MDGDFQSVDERGSPLSPQSEIMRLRAIIGVKDACLLNFSKTLRASDDKHKQTEAYLKDKVSELEEREASHRMVQAEHKALIGKHEKLLWSVQEQEERANQRIAEAEDKVKAAVEQRQAAEQLLQDRGREAYEKIAKAEEIVEMSKSALRLEVESLKGALMSADSERRHVSEELEELRSSAMGNEERLARADAEIEELRAIVGGGASTGGGGGGGSGGRGGKGHTAEAEIVRLSCELERCHISLSEAKREADMLRAHKRARDVEVQGLEHRLSVMRDEYRQLQRVSEGEMARNKAVWQSGESQARAEVMMLREQLSMARAGRSSEAQALYEREAMVAEIEELRGVVSGLEGRLAHGEAQRVRDRESIVRGEQRVLSLEEKLRILGEAEREAVERVGYMEREIEQLREKEGVRGRQGQGVSVRAVQDLEERLIAAKHQHQDQAMSLLGELKDLRARLNAKDSEARELQQRSMAKEEQLRQLTSRKAQADTHIVELTSEISCLRRDLQAAMARPQGRAGGSGGDKGKAGEQDSVEELRSLLADKSIEVANARDEARNLRMQLRESNAVLDEGKQHIVGLLKDVHKRDVMIRSLKDQVQQLQIKTHLKSAAGQEQQQQQQEREEGNGSERGLEREGVKPLFPHRDASYHNGQSGQAAVLADRTNQVPNSRFSAPPNPATPPSLGVNAVSLPQPKQHPLHMSGTARPSNSAATTSSSLHIGTGDMLVAIGGIQVDGAPMDEVRAAAKAAAGLGDVDITLRRATGDLYTIRARPRQAEALAGIPSP